jgi:hypothetical protein
MSESPTVTATEPDRLTVTPVVVQTSVSRANRLTAGIVLIVLGVLTIRLFGMGIHHGVDAKLRLGAVTGAHVPHFSFPGAPVGYAAGLVIALLGVLWMLVPRRRLFGPVMGVGLGLFVFALLCWVSTRTAFSEIDLVGLGTSTIGLAVPLILGALCGVMCERSGVINVAIEGQMLIGAWASALFGSLAGITTGLVAGAVAGAALGWLLAVFAIRYLVNQVVLGVVLNVFAAGLTGFFYDAFMQPHAESLNQVPLMEPINLPLLSRIPVVGPLLFQANLIVDITYVLIFVVDIWLFSTRWGLRTLAVGEHP